MSYHLYILYSTSVGNYYVGFTGDELSERLRRHNSEHKGYTGRAKDWKIVYKEFFIKKGEAMKREKAIKGWKSRIKIEKLIAQSIEHPDL